MTKTLQDTMRIRIDAPNAQAALALERRLSHLSPTAVGVENDWCVELTDESGDRLDEIIAAVEHWLADEHIVETIVHTDGTSRRVTAGGLEDVEGPARPPR